MNDKTAYGKLDLLKTILRSSGGCAVAFSGGVDSTFLLTVAHEVLGERCLAVIATSSTYPERERDQAVRFAEKRGIPHEVIVSEELDIPGFSENPRDRCFHCKSELFRKVRGRADARGLPWIADGSNADDTRDYRPGMRAARELGVRSPLLEAGLTKEDIRILSREVYDRPTADKQSMACRASRFPYARPSPVRSSAVERIEEFLEHADSKWFRARHHDNVLRLDSAPTRWRRSSRRWEERGIGCAQRAGVRVYNPRSRRVSDRQHERAARGGKRSSRGYRMRAVRAGGGME